MKDRLHATKCSIEESLDPAAFGRVHRGVVVAMSGVAPWSAGRPAG
jgi:hypothetical protein